MADLPVNPAAELNQKLREDAEKSLQESQWYRNKVSGAQFEVFGRDTIRRLENDDMVEKLNAAPTNAQTGGAKAIRQANPQVAQNARNNAEFAEEYNINVVPENLQQPEGETAQKRARKAAKLSGDTLNSTQE